MKTTLVLILGIFLLPFSVSAQVSNDKISTIYIIRGGPSQKETITRNLVIDMSKVANMEFMKKEEAEKRFGNSERLLVVTITPKPGVKLRKISEFYNDRKLNAVKRKLPLKIDGQAFTETSDVVIDISSVGSFEAGADSVVVKTLNRDKLLESQRKIRKN
jgi:hypothetical protein